MLDTLGSYIGNFGSSNARLFRLEDSSTAVVKMFTKSKNNFNLVDVEKRNMDMVGQFYAHGYITLPTDKDYHIHFILMCINPKHGLWHAYETDLEVRHLAELRDSAVTRYESDYMMVLKCVCRVLRRSPRG